VEVELVPLVDNVMVVLCLVVVSWRVVIVANMIGVFMFRAVWATESFSVDALQNILICLGLMRLVIFCILQEDLVHVC